MRHFKGRHTADNIRTELSDSSATWEIDKVIHVILRDNGPNVVKAINESSFVGIHTLQLQVQNVSKVITLARRIASHFNYSTVAQEKLQIIEKELNLPEHKLLQDVTTRWNSTYYMCERLVEQKRAISLYISENFNTANLQQLTEREW